MKLLLILFLFFASLAEAQAPHQNVKIKSADEANTVEVDSASRLGVKIRGATDNTPIGNTGDRLKVDASFTTFPTVVANQGTQGTSTSPWYINLRSSAGVELGTLAAPLRFDPSGTTTQPVSAASWPLPTGASTAALQTSGNALLTAIDAGIPAALGATTIAGSMPVTIASDQVVPIAINNVVDTGNSTSANLGIAGVFTGTSKDVLGFTSVSTQVFSTWGGTLRFEFSVDGTNWDYAKSYTINAANPTQIHVDVASRYFRVKYTNGSTATTTFRLATVLHPNPVRSSESNEAMMEMENVRGRSYVSANISGSATATVYTVTPGRVLRMTGGNITLYNSSLLGLAVGRLDITDGASTVRIPITIPGGSVPIFIPFNFPTALRFTTSVRVSVVTGAINYSIMFTGYEADD